MLAMNHHRLHLTLIVVFTLPAFTSCGENHDSPGSDSDTAAGRLMPDPICNASATPWTPGTLMYQDASEAWGLTELGLRAQRFHVADIDNDGWPDVLARLSSGTDDFNKGGARFDWLLHNRGDGTFEDVTQESGAFASRDGKDPNIGRWSDIVAWADVDNDGDVDLFTGKTNPLDAGGDTSEIMLNDGTGHFTFGPVDGGARTLGTGCQPAGLSFTDYDRDGNVDLWSPQFGNAGTACLQDRLLRGDGAAGFLDVTEAAGLTTRNWYTSTLNAGTAHSWGWGGSACDLNNDGWPELMASSYGRFPNHLWQGSASGVFTNRGVDSGYSFDENVDWTDNESARCYCHLHRAAEDCATVPDPEYFQCESDADVFRWDHSTGREPYQLGGNSGTTTCADVNNDGFLDLVTGEIAHWDVGQSSDKAELLVNTREPDVRFVRPGNDVTGLSRSHPATGWDEGHTQSLVFDFDLDGWPDIYWAALPYPDSGNHGRWYHQIDAALFEQVDTDDFFLHMGIEGAGAADFDRDGDIDMLLGHQGETVRLYENLLGADRNHLQIELVGGDGSNRMAIGAHVEVTTGDITQTQEVEGSHGHYGSQLDHVLTFGLGSSCEAEVTVTWPDAAFTTQTFTLPAGYHFRIEQGGHPEVATP
jgi:enediyne biosynthesis protein E4